MKNQLQTLERILVDTIVKIEVITRLDNSETHDFILNRILLDSLRDLLKARRSVIKAIERVNKTDKNRKGDTL